MLLGLRFTDAAAVKDEGWARRTASAARCALLWRHQHVVGGVAHCGVVVAVLFACMSASDRIVKVLGGVAWEGDRQQ